MGKEHTISRRFIPIEFSSRCDGAKSDVIATHYSQSYLKQARKEVFLLSKWQSRLLPA